MNEITRPACNIAAFFDLDGTILPKPSLERRFVSFLRSIGAIGPMAGLRWLVRFVESLFAWNSAGLADRFLDATDGNKAHLAGVSSTRADSFFQQNLHNRLNFFPAALRRLAWHVARDHAIYLVTGSLGPLAVCAMWQLSRRLLKRPGSRKSRIEICATQLEEKNNCWTGENAGAAVCGREKARVVERLALEQHIDLQRSYAYGNSARDRWMLEAVGNVAAVNPSRRLERIADQRGWPVLYWRDGTERGAEIQMAQGACMKSAELTPESGL